MPKHLTFFLCVKYLCRKKIVLLSIAAVMMSCALLIVVASLFSGFIQAVETSAGEQLGDVVISPGPWNRISKYDKLIESLQANKSVAAATAVLNGHGLLFIGKGNVRAVKIAGIELPAQSTVIPFAESLIRQKDKLGANFTVDGFPDETGGIVGVGVVSRPDNVTDEFNFAKITKEFIGTEVRVTTGTSRKSKPKAVKFRITDLLFSGYHDADNKFIYLPIETLSQAMYPGEGKVADMIQIKIADGIEHESVLEDIRTIWQDFAESELSWSYATIATSKQLQEPLLIEYRKQMGIMMLIFGIVSGGVVLLIFCIFYLIAITKQKDIAIVKSCGLGSSGVAGLFVMFGLLIGAVGSGLGVLLGYIVTLNINQIERWISIAFGLKLWKSSTYMFSRIPNQVDWNTVGWVVLSAILAAGIGALVPAIAAARVKPVEILRYE
jgi:lipoprotein-releasing system permease protein